MRRVDLNAHFFNIKLFIIISFVLLNRCILNSFLKIFIAYQFYQVRIKLTSQS